MPRNGSTGQGQGVQSGDSTWMGSMRDEEFTDYAMDTIQRDATRRGDPRTPHTPGTPASTGTPYDYDNIELNMSRDGMHHY